MRACRVLYINKLRPEFHCRFRGPRDRVQYLRMDLERTAKHAYALEKAQIIEEISQVQLFIGQYMTIAPSIVE